MYLITYYLKWGSSMKLADSVALITGGGSGLGAGAARQLAAAGTTVVVVDLPLSHGQRVADELGTAAHYYECDVSDPAAVEACIAWTVDTFGKIDICVNAAGIPDSARLVSLNGEPFPLDTYRRVIEVNLVGLFDVMRHAAKAMTVNQPGSDGERGLIVNVASIAGYDGQAGQVAYSASKGGVIAMTLPAARDLASWGIRVVTICPGLFDTGMLAAVDGRIRERLESAHVFPQRPGRPAEFGMLVESIVTNVMINGEVIRIDAAARLAHA